MIAIMFRAVDGASILLARLSEGVVLLLVASMIYEVAARYVFGAPTLWAFDIAYMSTGVIFLFGAACAVKDDGHVRIDALSSRLPQRVRDWIDGLAYLLFLCPLFAALAWIATGHAWRAFLSGEVETVSPWAPLMWPFYALIALGLWALALQLAAQALRALSGSLSNAPEF